jgi:hypothetical protein
MAANGKLHCGIRSTGERQLDFSTLAKDNKKSILGFLSTRPAFVVKQA